MRLDPGAVLAKVPPPVMYIATKNKPRKTDRKRSKGYRSAVKAKNRRRRNGLKK